MARRKLVAVIGVSAASAREAQCAEAVGRGLAHRGLALVCGGLGGVMEAASRGAAQAGGTVVGILPTADPDDANPFVQIAVATGMGDARNAVLADTADAFVAIGRGLGTLSEIAFALKRGKPVVTLDSWDVEGPEGQRPVPARTPEEALERIAGLI
jgi:uncharacterized protein (TIGR00725 family)